MIGRITATPSWAWPRSMRSFTGAPGISQIVRVPSQVPQLAQCSGLAIDRQDLVLESGAIPVDQDQARRRRCAVPSAHQVQIEAQLLIERSIGGRIQVGHAGSRGEAVGVPVNHRSSPANKASGCVTPTKTESHSQLGQRAV